MSLFFISHFRSLLIILSISPFVDSLAGGPVGIIYVDQLKLKCSVIICIFCLLLVWLLFTNIHLHVRSSAFPSWAFGFVCLIWRTFPWPPANLFLKCSLSTWFWVLIFSLHLILGLNLSHFLAVAAGASVQIFLWVWASTCYSVCIWAWTCLFFWTWSLCLSKPKPKPVSLPKPEPETVSPF